jgi:hypothetical protein
MYEVGGLAVGGRAAQRQAAKSFNVAEMLFEQ